MHEFDRRLIDVNAHREIFFKKINSFHFLDELVKRPGECISLTRTLITLKKFYFFKFYPKFYTSNVFWWKLAWRNRLGVEQSTKFHWNATQVNYGWNSRPFKVECVNLQFQDAQLDSTEVPVDHGDRVLSLPTVNWPVKSPANLTFLFCPSLACCFFPFFGGKKGKIYNDRLLFSPGHPPSSRVLFWGTLSMSMSIVFVRLCLKRPRNSGQKKGQVCPKLTWSDSFDRATSLGCPCVKLFAFFSSPSWSNKAECYESLCRQMIHSNFDKWMNRDFNKTAIRSIPMKFSSSSYHFSLKQFKFNVQKITNRREINWWGDTLIQSCH